MTEWFGKPYYSVDAYLKKKYGEKIYKVSLDAGFTCPNRDGTLGHKGCIFCSAGGSGDFAGKKEQSITQQIDSQIALIESKRPVSRFIAYFQAFTNTYGPLNDLQKIFSEAISHEKICILSIATRPDCLPDDVLDLLEKLNKIKPVWVELGLQTIHDGTARYIRRGYPLSSFSEAVIQLKQRGITVITHCILGLPGETREDVFETVHFLNRTKIDGIKLQLLHILKGTDLALDYEDGLFQTLSEDAYIDLVIGCIERLDPQIVIHRLTGDGPKELLIAPIWSTKKRSVLNHLHQEMKQRKTCQGRLFIKENLYD